MVKYLSLFSGAGGGDLSSQHLLGHKCVGYVEYEDYPQRVIAQRIKDGLLDEAPIFGDIRSFISEGYARAYQGMVDIVTGGPPCQPFSNAGVQLADEDYRNMWPETIQVVRIIRPHAIFFENVPSFLNSEYAVSVFRELSELGYEIVPPLILGSDDIGGVDNRKRAWIAANSNTDRLQGEHATPSSKAHRSKEWIHIERVLVEIQRGHRDRVPESWILRKGTRNPQEVDRIKAIGNMQNPIVAATAWEILTQ